MRALVTLLPAESKALIGRAVARLPEVRKACEEGVVVIGVGSTNAAVVQAVTGRPVDGARFLAGMITRGVLCVTPREERSPNIVLIDGKQEEITPVEALDLDLKTKVVIKGANAVDPDGTAGVLMAAADGGTVGKLLGRVMAAGIPLIVPVGLEKLVPSVARAASLLGKQRLGRSLGAYAGMMPLVGASVITEKQALENSAKVTVTQVAAGGIGGSEGAVTLLLEGERGQLDVALEEVERVKGTRQAVPVLQRCAQCNHLCDFRGLTENALPKYLS